MKDIRHEIMMLIVHGVIGDVDFSDSAHYDELVEEIIRVVRQEQS